MTRTWLFTVHLFGAVATLLLAAPLLGAAAPSTSVAPPTLAAPVGMPIDQAMTADIRDIHDPIWIPAWWRPWMLGIVLLAAGGATVVVAGLIARRRRKPLSASERALARLDEAAPLASAGESRLYAEAASSAVRAYLEERFGLPATHRTTDEFFDELLERKLPALQPHAIRLAQFLGACDLAKFSLYGMVREDMTALNELARAFVVATIQAAPPPAASPLTQPIAPPIPRPVVPSLTPSAAARTP